MEVFREPPRKVYVHPTEELSVKTEELKSKVAFKGVPVEITNTVDLGEWLKATHDVVDVLSAGGWMEISSVQAVDSLPPEFVLHVRRKPPPPPSADDDPRAKRQKLVPESEVALPKSEVALNKLLVRANNRLNYIRESYSLDPEFLWDPNSAVFLPYPSYSEVEEEGIYVGREAAKKFYDAVCHLSPGQRMLVIGAKGSGKSTVTKAIVGSLIASGKAALYLTISQIRKKNRKALLSGLALAFPQKWVELSLLTIKAWEEMIYWCCTHEGPVFLFIDDWDSWDSEYDEFRQINQNFSGICVKISSTNSDACRAYFDTHKPEEKYGMLYRLDGPYTEKELNTWIDNSGLLQEDDAKNKDLYLCLEKWTGGMPHLLKAFEEVQGDESKMLMKMEFYETRLKKFIDAAETTNELRQRFCMVTRGASVLGFFDSTCFYQVEQVELFTWHILCPYLQRKAESMILDRGESLAQRLSLDEIPWARAVEYDCRLKRNPACLGWNVEGLIIGVLKYSRSLFKNQFGKCIEYLRGQEVSKLVNVSELDMQEGILMVPLKFNEEPLDIFYIKLSDGKYILIAVQISLAKWKAKFEKGSHNIWKTEILERLKPVFGNAKYSHKFVYLMPKSIGEHDDEKHAGFERECFRNIHECLKWIDEDFELTELTDARRLPLRQCQGTNRLKQQCQAKGRYVEDNFFCRHHLPQAATYRKQHFTASSNLPQAATSATMSG